MTALAARHPRTEFVHVTVPLTITQEGPKALVKRLLGYPLGGEYENRARAAYNDWLRRTYASDALFDLAAVQSHTPGGDEVVFELDGRAYPRLYSGYTDDGTHLAGEGRRRAAKALLDVLGALARNAG
jgi:lysophospholipase L1-like esterase